MHIRRIWIIGIAGLLSLSAGAFAAAPTTAQVEAQAKRKRLDFNRDIRPIISDNCYNCHGPDKGHRKADLRLDTKEGLFGVKDDTYPVVPGKPDDSVLYMRITSDDRDYKMPHKDSNKRLTPAQIATIKLWIEQGAEWKGHWAYIPPTRGEVPVAETIEGFNKNPIDSFVVEKLGDHDLKPSPEADRRTLIRRLSLDLTGLPPTAAEVKEFVNDKSEKAYDKLVDRLLASPRYGERMSVSWMDLVRYGDTIGFHSDNPREVWPWRDWCIKAFNDNKRFDEFTTEQIAGDLIPGATRDQKVASAYNRLLLTTGEGGSQAKEYIKKYEADRVRNVSTTWMGATMGCAQCHDHKFDPYSQKDFYRLGAFFADIQEPAISLPQAELLLPSPEQQQELDRLNGAIAATQKKLDTPTTQIAANQEKWEAEYQKDKSKIAWTRLEVEEAKSEGGATLTIGKDRGTVLASGTSPATDTYTVRVQTKIKNITGLKVDAVPHKSLPASGPGRAGNGNFVLSEIDLDIMAAAAPTTRPVAFNTASASHEQTLVAEDNPYRRWTPLAAIDGDKFGPKFGWAILDKTGVANHAVFETAYDFGDGQPTNLRIRMKMNLGDQHTLGHFRLYVTDSPRPIRALPDKGIPPAIVKILEIAPAERTDEQKAKLAAHYRTIDPSLQPVRDELAALKADLTNLVGAPVTTKSNAAKRSAIPKTLISVSGPPRVVRVLNRGNWQDESGEIVSPGVPAFMKQIEIPPDRGVSRMDLAKWLVARDNPLTARVFVNRLWRMFYGEGLARPLDDLGSQGSMASHPELLDWLAVEFMESGWDVKHIVQLMVTSGAYRQSSNNSRDLREKDPFNKWLARQGSFRLDAEFVRDNALEISGLLVERLGGPSVKPYQPDGYWDFLNFPKRTYDQGHGEDLWRRGLYTWWQRTFLNPSLLNFDAPSHEECTAERVRSNTPQQALTLLNDITYVEAARCFAARIIKECNGDTETRIKWAYNQALSRDPLPAEVPILVNLLKQQQKRYEYSLDAADDLTSVGEAPEAEGLKTVELAAWTSVARTILNLHETITRN